MQRAQQGSVYCYPFSVTTKNKRSIPFTASATPPRLVGEGGDDADDEWLCHLYLQSEQFYTLI